MRLRRIIPLVLILLTATTLVAQDTVEGAPDFGLGITIGTKFLPDPETGEQVNYQSFGLTPDIAIGKFGLGLDLVLNVNTNAADGGMEIRRADWVPTPELSFLELYLPKLRYVRWGWKGDPLYVLLGAVDNGVLGNGFIMGGYTNTLYQPELPIFGMSLDVDGQLFGFPYVGIETFVANLAVFDLLGSRLYVRPLVGTGIPVIRNLQIGGTVVTDRQPFHFAEDDPEANIAGYLPSGTTQEEAGVLVWGTDFRLPILTNPVVSLAGFGDYVVQNGNSGGMVGAGGRLFGVMTYGAQIRMMGENFIPVYFGNVYDLYRPRNYAIYAGTDGFGTDPYLGWFASAGFSLLEDQLVFQANVDGPFEPAGTDDVTQQPHLLATFMLGEGLLGGFSAEASYDKQGIQSFADLIDPTNAVVGAKVNYRIESATISFVYDLRYNPFPGPDEDDWDVNTQLLTTISLF